MAATRRNCSAAAILPTRGRCSSPSDITPMSRLTVSSGTRLSSSVYSSAPSRIASTSGPGTKASRL